MFQPLKRIKRLYALSKKDPQALAKLERLTPGEMAVIPEEGDGKAVFIGEGSLKDFQDQEKADKGFLGIFGL